MNSIAVWYEYKSDDSNSNIPELDIHINHWKLRFNKSLIVRGLRKLSTRTLGKQWGKMSYDDSDYFIDIGLFVKNGQSIDNICIYMPCTLQDKTKSIEDIGERLKDPRVLSAVFNEFYTISTAQNSKCLKVEKSGNAIFNIYMLDIANDISVEKNYNGTILRLPFHYFNTLPTYYRFRLKSSFINRLSFTYSPSNALLESASSSIEVTDFRVNDKRDLNVSLLEHMDKKGKFNIALVHYFIMRSVRDEYVLSNQELNSVRQLEESTWTDYITSSEYKYKKTFAYHIKQKVTDSERASKQFLADFTAVFKFKFEDIKLLRYFFWFLIITITIALTANWLYDLLKSTKKLPGVSF